VVGERVVVLVWWAAEKRREGERRRARRLSRLFMEAERLCGVRSHSCSFLAPPPRLSFLSLPPASRCFLLAGLLAASV